MKRFILVPLIIVFFACGSQDSSSQEAFIFRDVTTGLDTPWEVAMGPDGMLWITERYGRISRVDPDGDGTQMEVAVLEEVLEPEINPGERGLMGLTFHPDFANQPWVYIGYTYGTASNSLNKVLRFRWENGQITAQENVIDNIKGAWNHDGCRVKFGPDGKLYVTMGDAADPDLSQDPSSLNGKILRMNDDGSVPSDNPYVGTSGFNPYVYSWGHRNPQGLVWVGNLLYSSEHGPDSDDELNLIEATNNYGWPIVHGYCDNESPTACEGMTEPLYAYYPNNGVEALAGIDYYPSDGPVEEWRNSILMTALRYQKVIAAKLSEDGREVVSSTNYFTGEWGRLRDILVTDDHRVFVAVSNKDGRGTPGPDDDRIIEITLKGKSAQEQDRGLLAYPNPVESIVNLPAKTGIIADAMGRRIASVTDGYWERGSVPAGIYYFWNKGRAIKLMVK